MTGLSEVDIAVLTLADGTWKRPGDRVEAIRSALGWSPVRFVQHLNRLLDAPAALAHAPVLVNRLRRQRDGGRRRCRT